MPSAFASKYPEYLNIMNNSYYKFPSYVVLNSSFKRVLSTFSFSISYTYCKAKDIESRARISTKLFILYFFNIYFFNMMISLRM